LGCQIVESCGGWPSFAGGHHESGCPTLLGVRSVGIPAADIRRLGSLAFPLSGAHSSARVRRRHKHLQKQAAIGVYRHGSRRPGRPRPGGRASLANVVAMHLHRRAGEGTRPYIVNPARVA